MTETEQVVWRGADYLRGSLVPIETLVPWVGNPRRGDVRAISESLQRFGQLKPVVGQGQQIVAGHHLVLAALELGWTHVAFGDHDFADEDEARAFLIADNRTAELGYIDEEALAEQLAALRGLQGTGYTVDDQAALATRLAALRAQQLPPAPNEAPAPPSEPLSRPGEVYRLGEHLLMCGSSAQQADVQRLIVAPELIQCVWTDPPYGVEYVGKTKEELTIANDTPENLRELLVASFGLASGLCAPHAPFYVAGPSGPRAEDFLAAFHQVGWRLHQILIWRKNRMVLGHSDYHYAHEFVFYGWVTSPNWTGRPGRGDHPGSRWYGGNDQTTVFDFDSPAASVDHPTMKPVGLIEAQLANSTRAGDVVYDPFGGSGSTLLACERLGRRARLMEVDPAYCDVVRRRYADYVGDPSLAP